jgi:hypothetical protein
VETWHLLRAFAPTKALLSGIELGVFDALTHEEPVADIGTPAPAPSTWLPVAHLRMQRSACLCSVC